MTSPVLLRTDLRQASVAALSDPPAAVLLLAAVVLLFVSIGVVSSLVMVAVTLVGAALLVRNRDTRLALTDPAGLGPFTALFGAVLIWQLVGLALRRPSDPQAASVLGSSLAIAMLLPTLAAAVRRNPRFCDRFLTALFVLGSLAAGISLALHGVLLVRAGDWSPAGLAARRLVPIGRAHHEIFGAGGLAATFFAGLALWSAGRLRRAPALAGLVAIAAAIAWTQSRGPIVGLLLATAAGTAVMRVTSDRLRAALVLGVALLCFALPVGLVVGESWIKGVLCTSEFGFCRPSSRQGVWATVLGSIPERPWLGVGPGFRFPDGAVPHAHNGVLGATFFFGIPVGILFLAIFALALLRAAGAPAGPTRLYALFTLFFSAVFLATDLANPFAFFNTHYLYLWIPLLMGAVLGSVPVSGRGRAPAPEPGKVLSSAA